MCDEGQHRAQLEPFVDRRNQQLPPTSLLKLHYVSLNHLLAGERAHPFSPLILGCSRCHRLTYSQTLLREPFPHMSSHWLAQRFPPLSQITQLWKTYLHTRINLELCPSTFHLPGQLCTLTYFSRLFFFLILIPSRCLPPSCAVCSRPAEYQSYFGVAHGSPPCHRDVACNQ